MVFIISIIIINEFVCLSIRSKDSTLISADVMTWMNVINYYPFQIPKTQTCFAKK